MKPEELSRNLERLASSIENAKNPSREKVGKIISRLVTALDDLVVTAPSVEPIVQDNNGFTVPTAQVIAHLIEWQNAKYTIDIVYRNFADRVRGPWRDSIYEHWYEHAKEERENAYNLSMKIIALGADPMHTVVTIPQCPSNLAGFCAIIKDLEIKAIEKGKKTLEFAGENDSLRVFAEDIILIDSQHLDDLARMCSDMNL